MNLLVGHNANDLLLLLAPTVHQWIRVVQKDLFTRIFFGDIIPDQLNDQCAYCYVRKVTFQNGRRYVVATYHFFHRYDYNDNSWPILGWFIRWADSHHFDFEGCTVFWEESDNPHNLLVTQAHDNLWFHRFTGMPEVHISACGHAVWPTDRQVDTKGPAKRSYRPGEYRLINIATPEMDRFLRECAGPLMKKYGAVHMPWDVMDVNMRIKFGHKSAWYDDPEGLLVMADECGLLKPEHKIHT
jgi:hypothetical protein